jgi:hypothetical protein
MHKFLHGLLISVFLGLFCRASAAADAACNKPASDTDALQLYIAVIAFSNRELNQDRDPVRIMSPGEEARSSAQD